MRSAVVCAFVLGAASLFAAPEFSTAAGLGVGPGGVGVAVGIGGTGAAGPAAGTGAGAGDGGDAGPSALGGIGAVLGATRTGGIGIASGLGAGAPGNAEGSPVGTGSAAAGGVNAGGHGGALGGGDAGSAIGAVSGASGNLSGSPIANFRFHDLPTPPDGGVKIPGSPEMAAVSAPNAALVGALAPTNAPSTAADPAPGRNSALPEIPPMGKNPSHRLDVSNYGQLKSSAYDVPVSHNLARHRAASHSHHWRTTRHQWSSKASTSNNQLPSMSILSE